MNIVEIRLPRRSGKTTMALGILQASATNYYVAPKQTMLDRVKTLASINSLDKDRMFSSGQDVDECFVGKEVHTLVVDDAQLCNKEFLREIQRLPQVVNLILID